MLVSREMNEVETRWDQLSEGEQKRILRAVGFMLNGMLEWEVPTAGIVFDDGRRVVAFEETAKLESRRTPSTDSAL